jgi:hypothetical protein
MVMLVNKLNKPIIWIRWAKTGGISIKEEFERINYLQIWFEGVETTRSIHDVDESKILLINGRRFKFFIDNNFDYFNKSFKFAVIRNPWDRFISSYSFCKEVESERDGIDNIIGTRDIKDVLLNLPTLGESAFHYWHLTKPQSETFILDGKNILDFQIRFENLQNDFNLLCDKIGIERMTLPHLNTSSHDHYKEYFDDETREIFKEKYKEDIKYLGYEF